MTCFDVEHGMFIRSEIHFIVKSKTFNFPFIRSTFSVVFKYVTVSRLQNMA